MARQLSKGEASAFKAHSTAVADQPAAVNIYRTLPWGLTVGLLIKAAGVRALGSDLAASALRIASPLRDQAGDAALVRWTLA